MRNYTAQNALTPKQRFDKYVDKTPGQGHDLIYGYWCWNWKAAVHKNGYGGFKFEGKMVSTHIMAWYFRHGNWPKLHISHLCNNKICVNPMHLEDVPRSKNVEYMVNCDRQTKGEDVHCAIFTEIEVLDIRARKLLGEKNISIALSYNASPQTICDIVKRHTWKHLA